MRKLKIKKGDTVQVITGSHVGERGIVKGFVQDGNKVIIENVNVVVRHIKPDYAHPQGSYKKEMPIAISNVTLVDPSTNKPGRIGYKMDENGKKVRYFKKSGAVL